jgi:hypothetical protein
MAIKDQKNVKTYVNLAKSMLNEQEVPNNNKQKGKKDIALRKKTADNVLKYLNTSESKAEVYIKRSIQIAEDPTKFKKFLSEMNEILATADTKIQSFGKRVLNYPKLSISKNTDNIEREIEDFLKISENNAVNEADREQAYDYFDKNPGEVDKFLNDRPGVKSKLLKKKPGRLDSVRILSKEASDISNTAKRGKNVHLRNLKKMSELIVSTRIDPVKVFSFSANADIFSEARAIYIILTILEDFDRIGKNMGDDEERSEKYLSIITPDRMTELYITSRRDFNKLITIMLKGTFARAAATGDAIVKAKEKPQSFSMAATGKLQEIMASYEEQLFSEDNDWYDSIRKGGDLRRIFDNWVNCNKINKSKEKAIFRYLLSSPPEKSQRLLTRMLRQTHSPNAPCNKEEEEYIPWASPLALKESLEIYNETDNDLSNFMQAASEFFPYSQQKLGFDKPVSLRLVSDLNNAQNTFGRTAHYDPNSMEIVIYTDNRHPKDMLRSFSHELVHHTQNCRGDFDRDYETGEGYAQNDPYMREKEAEAYLIGNGFMVRDYEDSLKEKNNMLSEEKIREMVRKGLKKALFEQTGVQEGEKPDFLDVDKDGDKEESMKDAAASVNEMAHEEDEEVVEEGALDEYGRHDPDSGYDELRQDRDDEEADQEAADTQEVDEASTKDTPDRVAGRDSARRLRPLEESELTVESRLQDKNDFLFEKLTKMWTK